MTDTERKRLVAILGMLGSDAPGERDNAARLAERFRKQRGVTWQQLLASVETVYIERPAPEPEPSPSSRPPPTQMWATACWNRIGANWSFIPLWYFGVLGSFVIIGWIVNTLFP